MHAEFNSSFADYNATGKSLRSWSTTLHAKEEAARDIFVTVGRRGFGDTLQVCNKPRTTTVAKELQYYSYLASAPVPTVLYRRDRRPHGLVSKFDDC